MNYLLIDTNSVGRAAHSSSRLTVGDEDVQAIFGTIRIIQGLLKSYPNHKPICLWDGSAQWRYDLFPLYKGNRSDNPQKVADNASYRAQRPHIALALKRLGVIQITDPDAEADDLAGYFSRKLGIKGNKVTLVTGDQDWQQLINEQVDWIDHRNDKHVNHLNFKEITGFNNVEQFVEAKAIVGDNSDNIPGIGGIGKGTVGAFLGKYESVDGFLDAVRTFGIHEKSLPKAHLQLALNEAPKDSSKYGKMLPMQDAFKRNMKLMSLSGYAPDKSTLEIRGGSAHYSKKLFKEFCEDLAFRSILIQLDTWIIPFQKLVGESK